jgi:hypothetical protein
MTFNTHNILSVDQWDSRFLKKVFLDRLRNETFDKIFIFTQNEFQFYTVFDEFMHPFLGNYIETKNLNVDLITSVPPESDTTEKYKGLNVHYWDTYWLAKTYAMQQNSHLIEERKQQLLNKGNLKYHFIMMNNRSHNFRAMLIDKICELDLLKYGAVSWHETDKFLLNGYEFKHFDGKPRVLDTKYFSESGGQYSLPDQYFESFAQLISESTPDVLFFSEKISTALLNGKVFLAAASVGIHNYLNKRLGIKYYDEIFDYEFDTEPDMDKRWYKIALNFKKLCEFSLNQLEDLQYQLQDKINFNTQRAIEIVNDTSFMPLPIRECFELFKQTKGETFINRHLNGVFESLWYTR